ncbi:MAG TPA: head GIN domain-containing protein [Sphingomonadaceae bacterium]|nr:head GIN domain-containing protein [Sphingomonadaceae bacterium]
MPQQKPKLRAREIVFAVLLGGLAAGGAALTISLMDDDQMAFVGPGSAVAGPSEMTYELAPFEAITTAGPQDIVVTFGDEISVRSEGSPRALSLLEAKVENGRLSIGPPDGFNWGGWGQLESATFYVTLPRLDSINLAGSGDVRIDKIEGERLEVVVGGPGELAIAELAVDEADFTVAGAGNIVAAGSAREARVTVAGAGEIQAGGLRSETASIQIGGAGDVALTVDREAQVSIIGTGDVSISGPAQCSLTRVGNGELICNGVEIVPN